MTQDLEGVIQCHDYSRICKKKVEIVLHSALSSPLGRSERFTLCPFPEEFRPSHYLVW